MIPRNPSLDVTNKNYRAPELLTQECSQKMDIYALGLILFELYSCSSSLEKEFYFKQLQHNHQLPDKYDMTNPHIAKLILLFTEPDPNKRPTISEFMNDDLL